MLFSLPIPVPGFSLIALSCGERRVLKSSKRQGWTWHCAVQVHTEDPGSFLSRSPRWDSPLALQSLDTHFPHSSARNTGCFFSHFQYCCSCSTLRLHGGGKVTREKRKKQDNETLIAAQSLLQVLAPFYTPPLFVFFSVFKLFCILPRIFGQWEKWGICGWSFCVMPITKHPKRFISFI